jgi:hypothetical protein
VVIAFIIPALRNIAIKLRTNALSANIPQKDNEKC